jgi:hypothetical protein
VIPAVDKGKENAHSKQTAESSVPRARSHPTLDIRAWLAEGRIGSTNESSPLESVAPLAGCVSTKIIIDHMHENDDNIKQDGGSVTVGHQAEVVRMT